MVKVFLSTILHSKEEEEEKNEEREDCLTIR